MGEVSSHLPSPGPPHPPNLDLQLVRGGGREDPGYYGCHGNSRFSGVLQCWEWRGCTMESYPAPGGQAQPIFGQVTCLGGGCASLCTPLPRQLSFLILHPQEPPAPPHHKGYRVWGQGVEPSSPALGGTQNGSFPPAVLCPGALGHLSSLAGSRKMEGTDDKCSGEQLLLPPTPSPEPLRASLPLRDPGSRLSCFSSVLGLRVI